MIRLADYLEDWRIPPTGSHVTPTENREMWKQLYYFVGSLEKEHFGSRSADKDEQTDVILMLLDLVVYLDRDADYVLTVFRRAYPKVAAYIKLRNCGIDISKDDNTTSTLESRVASWLNFNLLNYRVINYCRRNNITDEKQIIADWKEQYFKRHRRYPGSRAEKTFRANLHRDRLIGAYTRPRSILEEDRLSISDI